MIHARFSLFVFLFCLLFIFHNSFADNSSTSVSVIVVACNDGLDNDSDGKTDFPNDPGCLSATDENETDPQCLDLIDNDSDGLIDYPDDPGCSDANDNDETDSSATPPAETGDISGGRTGFGTVIRELNISGFAYPTGRVALLLDGLLVSTTLAKSDATFNFVLRDITAGNYLMSLYATDLDGVRSGILAFSVDLPLELFYEITNVFISPTISIFESDSAVAGSSVPGSDLEVVVFKDGIRLFEGNTSADENGKYKLLLDSKYLNDGEVLIKALSRIFDQESSFSRAGGVFTNPSATRLSSDVNNDGRVNLIDFSIVTFWFKRENPPERFDFNKDGVVDIVDLSIMAFNWTG